MRRTQKNKKNLRKRRSRGGGWSEGPGAVSAGYLEHNAYTGPGKDCAGVVERPGWIANPSAAMGLPGMRGGKRGRRSRRHHRGGTMPGVARYDPSDVIIPKPGHFPNPTGSGGTVAQPTMSMPGVPVPQKGGRYGMFPGMGPLNPNNGVGVSPAPFGRIACESGIPNQLNLNPNGIQTMTTAPLAPPVMRGGAMTMAPAPFSGASGPSAANFPTVQVGAPDSMRYYAPTAGYRNDFETMRAPSAVPGLTIQTPYDAKAFNQACIKTGGSRRKHKSPFTKRSRHHRGGAMPVAGTAADYSKVTMEEIGNRSAFDGTKGGLPVKFGGSRKNRKSRKNRNKKNH